MKFFAYYAFGAIISAGAAALAAAIQGVPIHIGAFAIISLGAMLTLICIQRAQ